jgi:hypothetical protein
MPHLLVDVSSHGLGHLSQTAPVLEALGRLVPELRLTVRSGLPQWRVAQRLTLPFDFIASDDDFGVVMGAPLEVDASATFTAYRRLIDGWERVCARNAAAIRRVRPDMLLVNASFVSLDAAERCGVLSLATSSLNWAEIFRHYCGAMPGADAIIQKLLACYAKAQLFLQLTPGLPMPALCNVKRVGPVLGRPGACSRRRIAAQLGCSAQRPIVLFAFAGDVPAPPKFSAQGEWLMLGPQDWAADPRLVSVQALDLPFQDLIASCDVLVTKLGYGITVEAASARKPVLFVPRPGWPEEPILRRWLRRHTFCASLRGGLDALSPELLRKAASYRPPTNASPPIDASQRIAALMADQLRP